MYNNSFRTTLRILFGQSLCHVLAISRRNNRKIFPVSDDESGEKSVSVLLAGEESELTFIDFATADLSVSDDPFSITRQIYISNSLFSLCNLENAAVNTNAGIWK